MSKSGELLTMRRNEVEVGFLRDERRPKGLDLTPDEVLEFVHVCGVSLQVGGRISGLCGVGNSAILPTQSQTHDGPPGTIKESGEKG